MSGTSLRARLLGSFELTVDGRRVERSAFERPSGMRLLKLLLATPEHRIRRESAAEVLWPELDPDRSGANLRKAIHFARRAVAGQDGHGESIIGGDGDWLRIEPEIRLDIDLDDVLAALAVVERRGADSTSDLDVALDVLATSATDELLPEDPYEEWLVPIRERLRQRLLDGLVGAAEAARAGGSRDLGFSLVERALAMDPADERAHRVAIELHLDGDHLHAARRQLQACRRAVAEAYGVEAAPDLAALIEAATDRRPAAGVAELVEAPIVGRRQELEAAEAALDRVHEGRAGAVLLRGPAGIGKSRVLRELDDAARASGWRIVEARGLEAAPEGAFAILGTAIAESLRTQASALAEPGRSALAVVAPSLAGPGDASRAPGSAAVAFASETALAGGLLDAIGQLVGEGPVVLAIDDIQWLDGPSFALLGAAVREIPDRPLLMLFALRDEPALTTPPLADLLVDLHDVAASEIALSPLGPREVRVLLEREAGDERVDDELARSIASLSAGSPLYALELLRGAREAGTIELRDGAWRLRDVAGSIGVPESVARLVERRIARLPVSARATLAAAAELGDEVTFEELVTAADADPGEVLDALDLAIDAAVLGEVGAGYRFRHPLFRAALRRGLPSRRRRELHAGVAIALGRGIDPLDRDAIDAAGGTGVDVLAVSTHAAQAAELGLDRALPAAIGFGFAAGERQADLFDFAGAEASLVRAIGLWHRLPEPDRAAYPASRAHVVLGRARRRLGDEPAAATALGVAVRTARDDIEIARAVSAAAWLPYEHGRFEEADAIARDGLGRVAGDTAIALLESDRGWILGRLGRWAEARPLLEDAVARLDQHRPSGLLVRALDRLAVAIWSTEPPERSIPVLERAVRLAAEIGDASETHVVRLHLGGAFLRSGDFERAVAELDLGRSIAAQNGDRYIEAVVEWNAAEAEEARGRLDVAVERRRRELEILASIGGNAQHEAMAHAHIAHLARALGDATTADLEANRARDVARHSGVPGLSERVAAALAKADWMAP